MYYIKVETIKCTLLGAKLGIILGSSKEKSEKPIHFQNLFVFLQRNPKKCNMKTTALNEAQMSILRLLGSMKSVEEVNELRQVICDYYARRVDDEMDRLWEEGKWDNEKNEAILQKHLRTPYNHA